MRISFYTSGGGILLLMFRAPSVASFAAASTRSGARPFPSPSLSSSLSMMDLSIPTTGMEMINDFFRTQPFVAAFMACSLKASTADVLAQTSTPDNESEVVEKEEGLSRIPLVASWMEAWKEKQPQEPIDSSSSSVNWNRTLAFYLYGGLYQGMFLQFLYTMAYPHIYGNHPHQLQLQVHTDIVLFGPFLTLPLAYIIRAWIDHASLPTGEHGSESGKEHHLTVHHLVEQAMRGLEKYKDHVFSQNLLWKYWAIWGPAQTFNFTMVPPHLRVVFVACVSFFGCTCFP
jgi:Mpv17 / PMP22 family